MSWIMLVVTAPGLIVNPAWAATRNWDGDTSAVWATADNWNTLPANSLVTDIANFNLAGPYSGSGVPYNPNAGTVSIAGITIGALNGAMTMDSANLSIGASGISVASGAGTLTLNSGTTTLGYAQTWANASANAFDIKTTLARSAGGTLNFNKTGAGNFTTSNNSVTLTNGIIGPWATYGTGTAMQYATVSGTTNV
jgi:hypothetical protein